MDTAEVHRSLSIWAADKPLVARLWIFGSRARGDHRIDSDIDIAVQLDLTATDGSDKGDGFATWIYDTEEWKEELATLLPFTVDLRQYRGEATPKIHQAIIRSSQLVYAKGEA